MRRFEVATLWTLALCLLLPACKREAEVLVVPDTDPAVPEFSDMGIRFNAGVEADVAKTRGTLMGDIEAKVPNDDDEQQPWRIWPWITGDQFTANTVYYFDNMTLLGQSFMHDVCVEATVTDDTYDPETDTDGDGVYDDDKVMDWTYDPVKMWPNQGYLDFFAYYPSKEMLGKMRINVAHDTPDPGLTLPDDMPEGDLVETSSVRRRSATRVGEVSMPDGISSLRFWHENPLDTVISFRCKLHPAAIEPPRPTAEGIQNNEPVIEYNDAKVQPDLMFAHHPHMAKPMVSNKVQMSFTHSMMAVRFWIKGIDADAASVDHQSSSFRNISNFTINSVSFGPVYMAGECVAYDNTDWQKYYEHLNEATQYSDEHVKLRYVWKYGETAPTYTVKLANGSYSDPIRMAPPYGGCEYRIPLPDGAVCDYHAPIPSNTPLMPPSLVDPGYPLPTTPLTDIFTQRCDFSILDYSGNNPFNETVALTPEGWQPEVSTPILPVLERERGVSSKYSAFIIPPQMFMNGNPYVRVTYTITEAAKGGSDPEKLTFTKTADIPMSASFINVEDGEILDLYLTFNVDGDDHFKFLIDAKVTPWQYGGRQDEEWTNW